MQLKKTSVIWFLVLGLLAPGLADAAGKRGRLLGKVLDPEGNPIQGVIVVATCDEVSRFQEEDTSDKKGVFKLDFPYLRVVYTLRFEKEGFYPLESQQDWDLEGTAREEFTMFPGEATVADAPIASASNLAIYNFNQGVVAFNSQDYATAEAEFKEALQEDSELSQAWGALAQIYLKQDRYRDSVEAAEKAIELGGSDESIWRTRWEAYRSLGDEEKTAQALLDLEDAGIRAEEAKRIHNEAVQLENGGDHEAAFLKFQDALKLDPNLLPALLGSATAAMETGRNEKAIQAATSILNSDPSHEAALRIRYNAAFNLEDEDLIIDALVGLATIEPDVAKNGLLKLAFDAYDADDMANAVTRFEKVLLVDPNNVKCHYYLGLIHVNEGAADKAKVHLQKFVQLAPDDPDAATAGDLLAYLNQS